MALDKISRPAFHSLDCFWPRSPVLCQIHPSRQLSHAQRSDSALCVVLSASPRYDKPFRLASLSRFTIRSFSQECVFCVLWLFALKPRASLPANSVRSPNGGSIARSIQSVTNSDNVILKQCLCSSVNEVRLFCFFRGGPLIVDLEFSKPALAASSNPAAASTSAGQTAVATKARARLEFFYLPFKDGEEQLESTLEANHNPGKARTSRLVPSKYSL